MSKLTEADHSLRLRAKCFSSLTQHERDFLESIEVTRDLLAEAEFQALEGGDGNAAELSLRAAIERCNSAIVALRKAAYEEHLLESEIGNQ